MIQRSWLLAAGVIAFACLVVLLFPPPKPKSTPQPAAPVVLPAPTPRPKVTPDQEREFRRLILQALQQRPREIVRERVVVQPTPGLSSTGTVPRKTGLSSSVQVGDAPPQEVDGSDGGLPAHAERGEALANEAAVSPSVGELPALGQGAAEPLAVSEPPAEVVDAIVSGTKTYAPSLFELMLNGPRLKPEELEQTSREDYGPRKSTGFDSRLQPLTTYDLVRGPVKVRLPLVGRKTLTTWGLGAFVSGKDLETLDGGIQANLGTRLRFHALLYGRRSWEERWPVFGAGLTWSW